MHLELHLAYEIALYHIPLNITYALPVYSYSIIIIVYIRRNYEKYWYILTIRNQKAYQGDVLIKFYTVTNTQFVCW